MPKSKPPRRKRPVLHQQPPKTAALTDRYHKVMGLFNGCWSSVDLVTDYAIYKFLNVTPQQAHLITSGMMFGRKARLLADLIGRSDHPNKAAILGAFNKVRANNKRDVFAHGYIWSDYDSVTFTERSISGEFKAVQHRFTLKELQSHVLQFTLAAEEFWNILGVTHDEMNAFGLAAMSLNRKSRTSPGNPTSSE